MHYASFLFLNADDEHTTGISAARVAEACERLGLRALNQWHWVLDERHMWLELSMWTVTPGQRLWDRFGPPGDTVNVIRCQPRPHGPRQAGIVLELAAMLGWQVVDPRTWQSWRDPGPAAEGRWPAGLGVPESSDRRKVRLATDGRTEPIHSISCLADGRVLVGQYAKEAGAKRWVTVRSGPELVRTGPRDDLGVPFTVCADGRRVAAGGGPHPLRIATLSDGELVDTAAWSVGTGAVWLPDWPSALLATTRHRGDRRGPPIAPDAAAAAELARLERVDGQRLLVIDTQNARIHPVGPTRFTRQLYGRGLLAVAGDGATAFIVDDRVTYAMSLDSGEVRWSRTTPATINEGATVPLALAASACGRFVGTGGMSGGHMPRVLDIRESMTGRVLAGFSLPALLGGEMVRSVAFHPGGWVAAGMQDGMVRHVTPNGSVSWHRIGRSPITALAFTPDGTTLLTGGQSGELWALALSEAEQCPPVPVTLVPAAERERRVRAFDLTERPLDLPENIAKILRRPT